MQLPETSVLTKVNATISVIATIVYIVAFARPYWLVKEFTLEALPPIVKHDLKVDSNIGLFKACRVVTSYLGEEDDSCTSKGGDDWQEICAVLATAALLFMVASCVLSVLIVLAEKCARAPLLKLLASSLSSIAAGLMIAVLIIYKENKEIQVLPPHPKKVDYNLGWSYLVTSGIATVFEFLVIINVIDSICAKIRSGRK